MTDNIGINNTISLIKYKTGYSDEVILNVLNIFHLSLTNQIKEQAINNDNEELIYEVYIPSIGNLTLEDLFGTGEFKYTFRISEELEGKLNKALYEGRSTLDTINDEEVVAKFEEDLNKALRKELGKYVR